MVVDDASSSIHVVFVVRRARRARIPELRTRRRFRAPVSIFEQVPKMPRHSGASRRRLVAVHAWRTRRGAMQDAERPRSLLRREIGRLGDDRRYGTSTSALSSTTSGSFEDAHHRRSYGLRASPPSAATSRRDVDDPDRYRHLYEYIITIAAGTAPAGWRCEVLLLVTSRSTVLVRYRHSGRATVHYSES